MRGRYESFEVQLKNFNHEVSLVAQYLYAELTIQHSAFKSRKLLKKLNETPRFWTVCGAALQMSAFISLGRIFDEGSPYNLIKLLKSMESNVDIFQRDALAKRKMQGQLLAPEWLDSYLDNAYYPTTDDFRNLRKIVKAYKAVYKKAIKPVRDKYYAHREFEDTSDVQALFASVTLHEILNLSVSLLELSEVLWQLLHNAKRPQIKQRRYAIKTIFESKKRTTAANEAMVTEVKKLMEDLVLRDI